MERRAGQQKTSNTSLHIGPSGEIEAAYRKLHMFDVEVEGRVHDGDVEVRFRLGECYGEKQAIGNRLGPVLREYMRRHHWEKENAPLCISFVETQAEVPNDEMPF